MKVIVKTNEIEIEKNNLINSGEYNITPCEFEFSEEYNGLTKMAVFYLFSRCKSSNFK